VIPQVISKIVSMQTGPASGQGEGLFLSARENKNWFYKRADDSVFGTASVVFLLNEIRELLPVNQQDIISSVAEKAKQVYVRYRNKDGLETYNFWKTKPSGHFPYGYIFRHMDHFRLPDDIDDTALIYMNLGHSEEQNLWLKEKLEKHTGPDRIYSTWFGKNMPHEQDICALCHLMYWIFRNGIPLNQTDENTLQWMKNRIVSNEIITHPFKTARHYATPPLIIYHLARLMFKFHIPVLAETRTHLIAAAKELFEKEKLLMNKVLISTALWKFGVRDKKYDISYEYLFDAEWNLKGQSKFYSFIGALLGPYDHLLLKSMAGSPLTRINWKCEAHELALCLENMVLTKS